MDNNSLPLANDNDDDAPQQPPSTVTRTPPKSGGIYTFKDGKYVELNMEEVESRMHQHSQDDDAEDEDDEDQAVDHNNDEEADGIYKDDDAAPPVKRFRLPAIIERPILCQQAESQKRRLYIWIGAVAMLVVVLSILLGVVLAHNNHANTEGSGSVSGVMPPVIEEPDDKNPTTTTTTTTTNTVLSTSALTIEDLRNLCSDSDSTMNTSMTLSEELLQRRDDLASLLQDDIPIILAHSCAPSNLALLWLAAHIPLEDHAEEFLNRFILTTLYLATSGESSWTTPATLFHDSEDDWLLQNNGAAVCDWKGVTCDEQDEVTSLILKSKNLTGTLPGDELAQLSKLQVLDLSINALTGTIPEAVVTLPNIVRLDLSLNKFTGTIPNAIFSQTQLQKVNLADSGGTLGGLIPTSIGTLVALEQFLARGINAQGTLPTELGNCASLKFLDLSKNSLQGRVPSELGSLLSLQSLYLKENTGIVEVAPEVCNLMTEGKLMAFDLKNQCNME